MPHLLHVCIEYASETSYNLSLQNLDMPCAIITSRSISPILNPPSLLLPSAGCLVRLTIGPIERLCCLSETICFNR